MDPFKTSETEVVIAVLHAFDDLLVTEFGINDNERRRELCGKLGSKTGEIIGKMTIEKIKRISEKPVVDLDDKSNNCPECGHSLQYRCPCKCSCQTKKNYANTNTEEKI